MYFLLLLLLHNVSASPLLFQATTKTRSVLKNFLKFSRSLQPGSTIRRRRWTMQRVGLSATFPYVTAILVSTAINYFQRKKQRVDAPCCSSSSYYNNNNNNKKNKLYAGIQPRPQNKNKICFSHVRHLRHVRHTNQKLTRHSLSVLGKA